MTSPNLSTAVQASTEATERHVDRFYRALDSQRNTIHTFFTVPAPDAGLPVINFNGQLFAGGSDLQASIQTLPAMHFDVHSFDCQVVNPALPIENRKALDAEKGKNASLLVIVGGNVRFGRPATETKGFSDTFLLVPNPNAKAVGQRDKNAKEWLVQSFNSRIIS